MTCWYRGCREPGLPAVFSELVDDFGRYKRVDVTYELCTPHARRCRLLGDRETLFVRYTTKPPTVEVVEQ